MWRDEASGKAQCWRQPVFVKGVIVHNTHTHRLCAIFLVAMVGMRMEG